MFYIYNYIVIRLLKALCLYLDWTAITRKHMCYISKINPGKKVNQLHIRYYAISMWKETN